jgi:hypothetical protein
MRIAAVASITITCHELAILVFIIFVSAKKHARIMFYSALCGIMFYSALRNMRALCSSQRYDTCAHYVLLSAVRYYVLLMSDE